jgi:hypothetical protein
LRTRSREARNDMRELEARARKLRRFLVKMRFTARLTVAFGYTAEGGAPAVDILTNQDGGGSSRMCSSVRRH